VAKQLQVASRQDDEVTANGNVHGDDALVVQLHIPPCVLDSLLDCDLLRAVYGKCSFVRPFLRFSGVL
jgi:hypothetical protein